MNLISSTLFNPFVRIAGMSSLGLGLAATLLACWIGSWKGAHFDGVLDMHVGGMVPLWVFLAEGVINWLSMALVLLGAGRLISKTAFRTLDLMGTQALARWPTVLMSLMVLAPGFHRYTAALMVSLKSLAENPAKFTLPAGNGMDAVVFGLVTLGTLLCTIWMVVLMWRSFSLCCNVRGGKAVLIFAVSLLVAEVVSKFLIGLLFQLA